MRRLSQYVDVKKNSCHSGFFNALYNSNSNSNNNNIIKIIIIIILIIISCNSHFDRWEQNIWALWKRNAIN